MTEPPPLLSDRAPEDLRARVRGWIAEQPADAIAAAALGMAERPDSTPDLATIDVPTLVITSTDDRLIPAEISAEMAGRSRRDASRRSRGPGTCRTSRRPRRSTRRCSSTSPPAGSADLERSAPGSGRGARRLGPVIDPARFAARYPFELDEFQLRAIEALDGGESVLVAAPTGSGKTVVAEFAVDRALAAGRKCFYTTPLKALSNQKFGDLVARLGAAKVGLLTGDNAINGDAPIVVMTTEVLRNMLYERSDALDGLVTVVMDEVHYLQDPYRGAVWEEVLIHLPLSVSVVCLSATISNAEEFGEWIGTLRGETRVVIEEKRPVPLEHHYLVGRELHPMHVEQDGQAAPNPYVVSLDHQEVRYKTYYRRGSGTAQHQRIPRPREGHRRVYVPRREEVVEVLAEQGMLPAIYFVFSRAGCDRSVEWLMGAGIRLTTSEEAARIRTFAEMRAAWMDEEDLKTLGFYDFQEALAAGIAAHHAGMLPVFKETVEELFEAGLVKIVFATETLSLGINMPARTVVIEDLWKFQGERHELLTPGEYTQLTGRAGRRGIDELGHAVVVFQRNVAFERVAVARVDPDVRAHLVVPTLVQHGREPGPQLHARRGAPPAELLVRAVPRGPRRRDARARARTRPGAARRVPRADARATWATSPSTGRCARRPRPSATSSARAANGRAPSRSARASRPSARAT